MRGFKKQRQVNLPKAGYLQRCDPPPPAQSLPSLSHSGRRDGAGTGPTLAQDPSQRVPFPPAPSPASPRYRHGRLCATNRGPTAPEAPPQRERQRRGSASRAGAGGRAGSPDPAGAQGDPGSCQSGRRTWKDTFPLQGRGPPAPGWVTSPGSYKGGGFCPRSPGPATPPPSGVHTDVHGTGVGSHPARTYWPLGSL